MCSCKRRATAIWLAGMVSFMTSSKEKSRPKFDAIFANAAVSGAEAFGAWPAMREIGI
jgi:hypothetical protein